jgi:alkanesulfonate monooxygenase SsuD/methylene tetrahydromethanopterin reductase-like flavin-dependent oxidoreductase (luciferase family)
MSRVEFGVQYLPQDVSWPTWRDAWVEADQMGFDSLWSYDHVLAPRGAPEAPCFEGWVGMAALASLTRRAKVGMLVSAVLFRNPALVVKMATTLDHVTEGRSILGLGAGWHVAEHTAFGWGFPPAGERVSRLGEALQIAHAIWGVEPGQPASFSGRYYQVDNLHNSPGPVQRPRPPILVAGSGPRMVALAARYADQYDCWPTLDDVQARHARLEQVCAEIGRDPKTIVRSISVDFLHEPDAARREALVGEHLRAQPNRAPEVVRGRLMAGSTAEMVDWLGPYVEAGIRQVILHVVPPYDQAGLERFAANVMPHYR